MELSDMILGFLDWKPMTGYELKGLFAELDFLPWSGNNNQIYKALLELEKNGLVTKEVIPREKTPPQKRYSPTEAGRQALRRAVTAAPGRPDVRNDFLLHLAWSQCLTNDELIALIDGYQKEIGTELLMCREKIKRKTVDVGRTGRESFIWGMIASNRADWLQGELNWLARLRNGLAVKGEDWHGQADDLQNA